MANDPLPLPDISAGSPDHPHDAQRAEETQDAEYEAIHAEIAATERGRWFLSEHVKRNPAADTDRLVGSLARAEAALRGGTALAMPRGLADDLAQLAAAIRQIEAVIAANAAPVAGGLAAGERIQDIAFALRERETDSTLCEALEVALFELGQAFAQHDAAAERAQSAAALLRGLEASINAMITLARGSPSDETASADAEPPALAAVADAPDEASPAQSGHDDSETESLRIAEPVEPPAAESVALSAAEPVEPPAAEPVELHAAEAGPAAHAGPVTPSMWETPAAAAAAESRTNDPDLSREASPGDIEEAASDNPAGDPLASAETLSGSLSGETVAGEALAEAPLLGDLASIESATKESAVTEPSMSEPPVTADSPSDDIASRGEELLPASEDASRPPPAAAAALAQADAEAAEPVAELRIEAVELTTEPPALDGSMGAAKQSGDDDPANTAAAVETRPSTAGEIESLLEIEHADPLPPAAPPTDSQEDLDDLFEPLPLEQQVPPATASPAPRKSAQQLFSGDLTPPASSSPVMQTAALQVQPPPLAAAPAPVTQGIPRAAPNDPLAALRALSEEELIALFS